MSVRLRSLIDASLPTTVPTVIGDLIFDYIRTFPHVWIADMPDGKPTATLSQFDGFIQIDMSASVDNRWYSFVSNADFGGGGDLRWSVCAYGLSGIGWSTAVGVTSDTANSCVEISSTGRTDNCANKNSYLFFPASRIHIYNNQQIYKSVPNFSDGPSVVSVDDWLPPYANRFCCVDFEADPETLTVVGRFADTGRRFVLMKADDPQQFWRLRPAVVMSGSTAVLIQSTTAAADVAAGAR